MGPKSFISGTDFFFFLRIVELHSVTLTVVPSLAKGETSPFCKMDTGAMWCSQESTHRHTVQYSLLAKEVRLKVKAVFEKCGTLADPLNMDCAGACGNRSTDGQGGATAVELTLGPPANPWAQHLTQGLTASCKAHLSRLQSWLFKDKCSGSVLPPKSSHPESCCFH